MASPFGGIITLLMLLITASSCAGKNFYVGIAHDGNCTWTTYPAQPQDQFQINDTLFFMRGFFDIPVLRVNEGNYATCNTNQLMLCLDRDDHRRFVLDKAGYYYFISANARFCQCGERIKVQAIDDQKEKTDIDTLSPPPPPPKLASASSVSPPHTVVPFPRTPLALPPFTGTVPRTNVTYAPSMSSAVALPLRPSILAAFSLLLAQ